MFRSNKRPMNKVSDLPTVLRDVLQPFPSVLPQKHQLLNDKKARCSHTLFRLSMLALLAHLLMLFYLAV